MNSRLIIALIIFIILDIYAFQAFRGVTKNMSPDFRRFLMIGYWTVSALAYIVATGMMTNLITDKNHFMTIYGRTFLMVLFLSKLCALPILLIDDIRRGFLAVVNFFMVEKNFDVSRSKFLSAAGVFLGTAPIVALTYGALRNPYRYRVRRNNVYVEGLHPDLEGFKIVQISDIHSGSFVFKDPILNGIELINKENADLVVFTGDIVNYKADEMDGLYDTFRKIKTPNNPVFSTLGNHDYGDYYKWSNKSELDANFEKIKNIHTTLGWDLLMNEHRIVEHKSAKIGIIGVENFSALPQFPKHGDLKKSVEGMVDTDFKMLLSHDPSHWDFEVNKHHPEINLTLSGHTHGFQFGIEIPGWIKWSPSQFVYKQWAGLYQKGAQYLYVNRGFGFLGYAGRVGILPEITSLVLTGTKPIL